MKRNDYLTYNYKQLVEDEFFINSTLLPTAESEAFWKELEKEDDNFSRQLEIAKKILSHTPCRVLQTSSYDKDRLFDRIHATIQMQKIKRRNKRLFAYGSVAAGLILICLFSWKYISDRNTQEDIFQIAQQLKPATPADHIQLIQSGQKDVAIYGNESDIQYDSEGNLSIHSHYQIKETGEEPQESNSGDNHYTQLVVPPGKRSSLTLSDGTKVWVNANSRVVYPDVFDDHKRIMYVDGEVFLEVKPDPQKPFVIHTKKMNVLVKGTSFNVSAYESDDKASVVLVTGSVQVNTPGQRQLLLPDEMLHVEENRIYKETVNVHNHISWIHGAYIFDNERFSVILNKLSRYYSVKMEWDKPVEDLFCSGSLNLSDDLDKLLKGLQTAVPVTYTKTSELIKISINPEN